MPWSRHSIAFSCSSYVGKPCCRQRDLTGGRSGVLGPWGVGRIVALWRIFHGRWLKNHRKTDSNQLGLHFVKWFVSQSAFNSVSHSSLWVDQIKSNQYMRALWSMLTNSSHHKRLARDWKIAMFSPTLWGNTLVGFILPHHDMLCRSPARLVWYHVV